MDRPHSLLGQCSTVLLYIAFSTTSLSLNVPGQESQPTRDTSLQKFLPGIFPLISILGIPQICIFLSSAHCPLGTASCCLPYKCMYDRHSVIWNAFYPRIVLDYLFCVWAPCQTFWHILTFCSIQNELVTETTYMTEQTYTYWKWQLCSGLKTGELVKNQFPLLANQ